MRSRLFPMVLAVTVAIALSGCSGSVTPEPIETSAEATPSAAADPTTLEELQQVIVDEGLVDGATLEEAEADVLSLQLVWLDAPGMDAQFDAVKEVNTRIDALPHPRPAQTQTTLISSRADGTVVSVMAGYDVADETLRGMLDAVDGTACSTAILERRDPGDDAGERAILDMTCAAAATHVLGLARSYDEVTSIGTGIPGVESTTWEVSMKGEPTTDALLRLDAGPIAGRQQVLTDAMATVMSAGASRITVIDTGVSITVTGFADADQTSLCSTLIEQLRAAGVERVVASMQTTDVVPETWTCYVR